MRLWRTLLLPLAWPLLVGAAMGGPDSSTRVLATDRDLDGLAAFPARPLASWQWSAEEKRRASEFSRVELARDAAGTMLLSLKIAAEIPFKRPYLEALSLGNKYLPPEADALRMKIRAVSGGLAFTFGGPTAYFGNSDAFLRPVVADAAADGPEWRTVEFSLHHGLWRNFRRASYSATAPWIYYARWTQEPTYLYVLKGSAGEIQIRDLEVVARGLARPFPVFGADDLAEAAVLADFSAPSAAERAFSALVGDHDREFAASWEGKGPVAHPPAELAPATEPDGGCFLRAKGRFFEEVSAVGVTLAGAGEGDALRFSVRVATEAPNAMLPSVECQPLDFLLYEAPDPAAFDWRPFLPSPEWTKGPAKGYGRNLAFSKLKGATGLSVGIWHARRFVPKGTWTEVIVPLDDFLCIYGSGDLDGAFARQLAPEPRKLLAAAVVVPWPRKGRFETTVDLRKVSLAKFLRPPESRRSYYQLPDPSALKSVRTAKGGFSFLLPPGESDLPPEVRRALEQME